MCNREWANRYTTDANDSKEETTRTEGCGGIPSELFESKELTDLLYPRLLADFDVLDQLEFEDDPNAKERPIQCPVDFFDGEDDIDHDLTAWRGLSRAPFTFRHIPGGHFFLREPESSKLLINHMNQRFISYQDFV
ncbi:S-acyl fatty acid synthase thioesterase, medium chain [Aplysia californica]|uniref:oleoyl-[acyl-carrier-protein] hydrolase n=1 Tax=Aplysia californica TaxID=6500 RepID=A0ABM1A5U3_APLCA|nr:S-acyl fatty acid synthase thioesterase, medium chain [Aplysia californica]